MMAGSKATRCSSTHKVVIAREATVVALVEINLSPLPLQQSTMNVEGTNQLHLNLIQAPQIAKFIQVTLINPLVLPLVLLSGALLGLQVLQANLVVQGPNELLNNVYNIPRKKNSHALEGRLQRLEESLHNAPPRGNTVQEVASKRNHTSVLEQSRAKRDEALRLRD